MPNFDVTQLALLFFPGIIARILLGKLLFYKEEGAFKFILHAFVLGTLSYLILFLIKISLIKLGCTSITKINDIYIISILDKKNGIDIIEVLLATLISIPLVAVISLFETKKYLSKFSRYIKISTRFSEPDVWGYALNSDILNKNEWVTVRNKKENLMYQGRVRAFSDSFKEAEILLEDVQVFNNDTGFKLYDVDALYLALEAVNMEIQFYGPTTEKETPNE